MGKIIVKCPNCGEEFETSISKKVLKQTYCSNECYKEYRGIGKNKTGTCVVCGKQFELVHGKGTKVCSKECLRELKSKNASKAKEKRICKNCGKEFNARYSTEQQDFCCRDCYWEYRRKRSESEYSQVFKNRVDSTHEVRSCEMCGKEFVVYKNYKKRFCSDECRIKYQNTSEFKEKRISTMIKRYGKKSVGNGITPEKIEEYEAVRKEKYKKLCEESDLDLIEFLERHILLVRCRKCGKEFVTNNLSYIQYDKIHCKYCSPEYKDYTPAIKIYDLLDSIGVEYLKNDRIVIKPYELDVYIPSKKLAIEVNGNFWHSELCGKDKEYHIKKTKLCDAAGVKLIHVFEDEIANKWEIVKSRIMSMLGLSSRIYARKCSICELSFEEKREFMNKNHIQGDSNSSINIGLKYNGEIVAAMTFSKERVIYNGNASEGNYELIRFANKIGCNVVGGFSKLLKNFLSTNNVANLKTFCDVRWSGIGHSSTVYEKCGFVYSGLTKPNY